MRGRSRGYKRHGKLKQTKLNRLGGIVGLGASAFSAYRSRPVRVGKGGKRLVGGRAGTGRKAKGAKKSSFEITSQRREFANAPGTCSKFVEKHRHHKGYGKMIGKLSQPRWKQLEYSGQYQLPAGQKQMWIDQNSYFTVSDMQNMIASAGGSLTQGNTGRTLRLHMDHCYGSVTYTNLTNNTIIMEIYDTMFKKKQGSGATYTAPFATANLGEQDEQGSTITSPLDNYGMKPGDSLAYRDRCKTLGHTRVMLGPGEVHVHKFFYQMNRVFNAYELQDATSILNGWTRWTSFIAYGTPVKDQDNNNIQLGQVEIGAVTEFRYRYRFMSVDTSSLAITNNIPITTGTKIIVEEKTGSIIQNLAA